MPFSCSECAKTFSNGSNFRRHVRACGKSWSERSFFVCPLCPDRRYSRKSDLVRKHIRVMHQPGDIDVAQISLVNPPVEEWTDEAKINLMDSLLRPFLGAEASDDVSIDVKHGTDAGNNQDPVGDSSVDNHAQIDEAGLKDACESFDEAGLKDACESFDEAGLRAACESLMVDSHFVDLNNLSSLTCPHGVWLPIHIYSKKTKFDLNGNKIETTSVKVNCSLCPPPIL